MLKRRATALVLLSVYVAAVIVSGVLSADKQTPDAFTDSIYWIQES